MTVFLSNRDGNGKTNEEGHYRLPTKIVSGFNYGTDDLKVSETSPLTLGVYINTGDYRIESGSYAFTGWNDAIVTVTIPTAAPVNPRISLIVIYVDKLATTTASPPNNPGITKFMAVQGSAAASPIAPSASAIQVAVGSGNPYYVIASVLINGGTTQVTNSNITDMRQQMKVSNNLLDYTTIFNSIAGILYPVGSIYSNATNSANPSTLLGFGTWTRFAQSRVLVGQDTGDIDFATLGAIGGAKDVTITEGQMPNHNHAGTTSVNGNHSHSYSIVRNIITAPFGNNGRVAWEGYREEGRTTSGNGDHNHSFTTTSKGNGQSHTNLQPYVVVYMWRRTA